MRVYETKGLFFARKLLCREIEGVEPEAFRGVGKYVEAFLNGRVHKKESLYLTLKYFGEADNRAITLNFEHGKMALIIQKPIKIFGFPLLYRGLEFYFDHKDEVVPGTTRTIFECFKAAEYRTNVRCRKKHNEEIQRNNPRNLKAIRDILEV